MSDFSRPRDLLVAGPFAATVMVALPGWRVLDLRAALPHDAAPVAGIIASEEHLQELEEAGFKGLPVIRMSNADSLAHDLVELLANDLHEARLDAAEARRAAALLRRETDEQARRMRMLEGFTHALGGPRHVKALDRAPTSYFLELSAPVTQRLPLSTLAVAAIDLWLPDAEAGDVAGIAIEALDAEGEPLARFTAEARAGPGLGGWARFRAAEPLPGPARDLVLRISAPAEARVALGLGTPVPDQRFAVRMEGAAIADSPAAMRVWRADYLATLPRANGADAGRGTAGGTVRRLPLDELGAPDLLFRPPLAQDYVAAEYWANEDAILLHPSAEGPVCAILRDVEAASVTSVGALVNVAHPESPILGFAVGACPRGMAHGGNWRDHIGPYVFLPPGGWGECHHILPFATHGRTDILLSTMVAGRGPNDHSWALFRDLRVGSLGAGSGGRS